MPTAYVPWSPLPASPGCIEVATFPSEKQSKRQAPRSLIQGNTAQTSHDTLDPQAPDKGFHCTKSMSRVMPLLSRPLLNTAACEKHLFKPPLNHLSDKL